MQESRSGNGESFDPERLRAWARTKLGLEDAAESPAVREKLMQLLAAENFVPNEAEPAAAEMLLASREPPAELVDAWWWDQLQTLDQQVGVFAAQMLRLEPAERRRRWVALQFEAEGFPRIRARLDQLRAGLDLTPPAEEDLKHLADCLQQLFPLRGASRAARRHSMLLELAKEIERWEEPAKRLKERHPEWAAVDADFITRLATWREMEEAMAGNRGGQGGKYASQPLRDKWKSGNAPQGTSLSGGKSAETRQEAAVAAVIQADARRAAPRSESRVPWIAIVIGGLVISGLARGLMQSAKQTPPRPGITLPQNFVPPKSTSEIEEMLRRMREEANRPNPSDPKPLVPERETTPLDAFSGLPAEDAERLRRLLQPELPQPRRADPNEPNPWRISPTRPNPARPQPPAFPPQPGGVLPPIQGPQLPNRPTP